MSAPNSYSSGGSRCLSRRGFLLPLLLLHFLPCALVVLAAFTSAIPHWRRKHRHLHLLHCPLHLHHHLHLVGIHRERRVKDGTCHNTEHCQRNLSCKVLFSSSDWGNLQLENCAPPLTCMPLVTLYYPSESGRADPSWRGCLVFLFQTPTLQSESVRLVCRRPSGVPLRSVV